MKLKKGCGYWDVTNYPYGGYFRRTKGGEECEIITDGPVQHADEVRIKFADNREAVIKSAAIDREETSE